MRNEGLQTDLINILATQSEPVRIVVLETIKYIEHLETLEDDLDSLAEIYNKFITYLDKLDGSSCNETKSEILDEFGKIIGV